MQLAGQFGHPALAVKVGLIAKLLFYLLKVSISFRYTSFKYIFNQDFILLCFDVESRLLDMFKHAMFS